MGHDGARGGLGDLHFVAVGYTDWSLEHGFDAAILNELMLAPKPAQWLEFRFFRLLHLLGFPSIQRYRRTVNRLPERLHERVYCVQRSIHY